MRGLNPSVDDLISVKTANTRIFGAHLHHVLCYGYSVKPKRAKIGSDRLSNITLYENNNIKSMWITMSPK